MPVYTVGGTADAETFTKVANPSIIDSAMACSGFTDKVATGTDALIGTAIVVAGAMAIECSLVYSRFAAAGLQSDKVKKMAGLW